MQQIRTGTLVGRAWRVGAIGAMCVCASLLIHGCGGSGGSDGSGSAAALPTATVTAPIIATQPRSQTVSDGQSATFTVTAAGTAPLAYQWLRGGQAIAGATQSTFTMALSQPSDNGTSFSVVVSNGAGTATSAAAVLTVQPVAPTIPDSAPRTVSVLQGAAATFSVTVNGSSPLTFQWRRNGAAIGGATTSSYTTPATTAADNGAVFDVVVTNVAGTTTSAPFTLTVTSNVQAATIVSQPQPSTVRAGDAATFAVAAGGTAPFSYQWLRNGQAVAGAIASTYTLSSTQLADNNAVFSVVVTNAGGSATSAGALLMVLPQPGIAVIAGNIGGPGTIDGTGTVARFAQPQNVAVDNGGNLYVADGFNVRKVTPAGIVTLFAGSPTARGSADGTAAAATFRNLAGVAVAPSGIVYLADADAHTIRRVDTAGTVSTFAGMAGVSGSTDGSGTAALFNLLGGLATDAAGNVYVADTNQIRKITPGGVVTTLAGSAANTGFADGAGAAARFAGPSGVAVDAVGTVYVADTGNHAIRIVSPLGVVTTLAGTSTNAGSVDGVGASASFDQPTGISLDGSGNVYVSDVGGAVVRKIAAGAVVSTIAGSARATGIADGTGSAARFAYPVGIASDASGVLFVVDRANYDVRRIATNGAVTRFAGLPAIAGSVDGTGSAAQFALPFSIAIDAASNLYVGDYNNASVRKIAPGGLVSTLAGNGSGSSAAFASVQGLAVDAAGNVYVVDRNANLIRKVAPSGAVTTFVGSGVSGSADGTGAAASFNAPTAIVYDVDGDLYVVDGNPTVRRVTTSGVVTTIAGAAGRTGSADGAGNVASFSLPQSIAADAAGNLYVGDTANATIRKVTTAGVVSTIAGTAGQSFATDGNGAAARFTLPFGIAVDASGNLFVMDTTAPTFTLGSGGLTQTVNARFTLRKIDPAGNVTTVAGVADGVRGVRVGALPGHFDGLYQIAVDRQGNLYGPSANGILRITLP